MSQEPSRAPEPGAFSENGPWRIDPARLAWARGLAELRAASRAAIAPLVRPRGCRRSGASSRPARAVGGALVGWALRERRARRQRVRGRPLAPAAASPSSASARRTSSSAQIVSSGRGLFPPELVEEFKKLPRPGAARAVRGGAARGRGGPRPAARRRSSRASTSAPIAAASIAQVHAAHARDRRGGRGQGAAAARRASSCGATSRRWRGSRRASSAASRWRRSRTRPRWSSSSPRRSSRSSTSGSRPRTCSTSRACCARPASATSSCRGRTRSS